MKTINYLSVLAAVSVSFSALAEGPVSVPKTNNIMPFNVVLTAWPNAVTTPHMIALRQATAQFNQASSPVMGCPIIGGTNDYFPGSYDGGDLVNYPVDPAIEFPPEVIIDDPNNGSERVAIAPLTLAKSTTVKVVANSNAPFRLTSRDLINSLNGVTNNGVALYFGNTAQLLFKQILSPATLVTNTFGANRQLIVRQVVSRTNLDTDVSRFFVCNDNYVSTYPVGKNVQLHKISTLLFVNPNKMLLQLAALQTEIKDTPKTNGVSVLDLLNWSAQGSGQVNGSTNILIISGTVFTGAPHLE